MNDERKTPAKNQDNEPLRTEDPAATPQKENAGFEQIPDLDGDGMIGYTGGNYGDTTYTGGNLIQPQPGPVEEAHEPETEEEDSEEGK